MEGMRNTGVKGKSKILTGAIEGWSCHTEMDEHIKGSRESGSLDLRSLI